MTKKRLAALFLATLMVFTLIPLSAVTAYADSGDPAMVMGSSVLAKNASKNGLQKVYFGSYNNSPNIWYVIGYDGQGNSVAAKDGLITIFRKNITTADEVKFYPTYTSGVMNSYTASSIRWDLNSYYNEGGYWKWNDSKEKGIIVQRVLEGGGQNYKQPGYDKNKIKGDTVTDAYFWLLSPAEAEQLPAGVLHLGSGHKWWLRTPGSQNDYVAVCYTDYSMDHTEISYDGNTATAYRMARPACDLDMNAIVFTSAAQGGKASGSGADALTAVGSNNNDEWKLTIKDGSNNNFDVTTCDGSYNSDGGSFTFLYSGAKVVDNSYISAIIVGDDDSIKYYGRVAEVFEKSGQVTVNTAGKMESGDKLYVYNEQYNGDKITDYASNLVEVGIPTSGDHDWGEADCTTPKTCRICGNTDGEALGHDYQEEVEGTAVAPTCTEAGKEADKKCTRCDDVAYGAPIPPLGHDWGDWDEWTTGDGTLHKKHSCQREGCDAQEEIEIETDHRHTYPSMGYSEEKPATCTEEGTRKHFECSCGYWFEEGDDGAPVVEDETGEGKTSDDFVIEPLGHDWKEATCTTPKTCKRCDATEGSPLAHIRVFDGWDWKGDETNGYTDAIANYRCTREGCGDVKAALVDFTKTVIPPTCTAEGKTIYKAVVSALDAFDNTYRSEKREGKITEPLGHDYQEVEDSAKEPTCTEAGKEKDQVCSRCGDVIEGEEIPAKGHTPREAVKENEVPATCAKEGSYDSVVYCDVCEEEISREKIPVAKLDHTWDEGVVTKEPTTTETGEKTYTCTVCGETRIETIDKLVEKATVSNDGTVGNYKQKIIKIRYSGKNITTFQIWYRTAGGEFTKFNANKDSYQRTLKNLKDKGLYEIRVYGKDTSGSLVKAAVTSYRYMNTNSSVKLEPKSKSIRVVWNKISAASGFQIRYSLNKNMSGAKTVKSGKGSYAKTLTGLKSGKTYYVQVRPYVIRDGKTYWGIYSDVKSVKAK